MPVNEPSHYIFLNSSFNIFGYDICQSQDMNWSPIRHMAIANKLWITLPYRYSYSCSLNIYLLESWPLNIIDSPLVKRIQRTLCSGSSSSNCVTGNTGLRTDSFHTILSSRQVSNAIRKSWKKEYAHFNLYMKLIAVSLC